MTALDERNNDPMTDTAEQHKFRNLTGNDPPVLDVGDMLSHNSDQMQSKGTDNAVQKGPAEEDDIHLPSPDPILVGRMVYENVPSTGYVGIPLDITGGMGLQYEDANGDVQIRNVIGGPMERPSCSPRTRACRSTIITTWT